MFKTKSELDKHVGKMLMRARTDSDKNREGLKIARLYFDLKEYESADFYLTNYLSEFSLDAFAWKLKAEIIESIGKDWHRAVEFYSRSFKLGDESEKKLLLKICNCYNQMDKLDSIKAKEWLDKAVKHFPLDKSVVDLKEKILNKIDNLSEIELNEWEIFLTKAMNENFMNQELHLKFLKLNLKRKNYVRAIKHLIKVEYKYIFQRAQNLNLKWYDQIIELFEEFLKNQTEFNGLENNEKILFHFIFINLLLNQLLNLIQSNVNVNLNDYFIKLDWHMLNFHSKNLHLDQLFDSIIYNEIESQYYYIIGLILLSQENYQKESDETLTSVDGNQINSQYLTGVYCLLKSIFLSKPDNSFLNHSSIAQSNDPTLQLISNDYLKLLHRDSCLKYSVIGNWLKFIIPKNFSNDYSNFLILIQKFSISLNIKDYLNSYFNLENSFLSVKYKECLSFDKVFEAQVLDYADKYSLENQSFNLNFLVWHGLMNTNFDSKYFGLNELPPYTFFRSTKNIQRNDILFGVENLNICNIESLCLMDLKIFYYSTYYQSLSYLNSKKFDQFKIKPFWIETNLTNESQLEWWYYSAQHILRSSGSKNFFDSSLDDLCFEINIDSKKQNEFGKILELIRLKSQTIKLTTNTRFEQKFKSNLNITIAVTRYLQFLNDSIESINLASNSSIFDSKKILEEFSQTFVQVPECINSPKEKHAYLKYYLIKYWTHILKQLIKLKQISYSNDDQVNDSICDSSILNESVATLNSTVQGLTLSENYFNSYESMNFKIISPSKSIYKASGKENIQLMESKLLSSKIFSTEEKETIGLNLASTDSIIQSAQLNLILIYTLPDAHGDFIHMFQNLNEAVGVYELVEKSLGDRWKNELNFCQLQICKRLGETLVLQRDSLESIKSRDIEAFRYQNLAENLEKIQKLIEFTKKKINAGFNKSLIGDLTGQTERIKESINASFESPSFFENPELLCNTSISESIRDLEKYFTERAENTPEALQKKAEHLEKMRMEEEESLRKKEEEERLRKLEEEERIEKQRQEEEKQKIIEIELRVKKQLEEEMRIKKLEENERREREEKENLKRELLEQQERIKKLVEEENLRWNKQKEEIEKEKIRIKNELSEEMNRKVQEIQAQKQQDQVDSEQKGLKIANLIETLNKQRTKTFELNKETLIEQFSFIRNQNDKLKYHIRQIKSCTEKRHKLLNEFRQIVKQFNEICDNKILNDQFNVLFWLFQHNPGLAQLVWHQQNILYEIKLSQEQKQKQTDVKTPTKNQTIMNETSFLSVNEFQTPESKFNKNNLSMASDKSQSYLDKPIGEIKFPSNINVIDQLKKSADTYNKSQQSLDYDDEDDQEGEYYDEEDYDQNDYENEENQTRPDTFLSCEDFDLSKAETSKSSINELQILFDQMGYFYIYDIDKRLWISKGKCNLQIIGDEISQKGNFYVHIICNLVDDKKTYEYNLTKFTYLEDFSNSNIAVYLYDTKRVDMIQQIPEGIKFENESIKNEFKKIIENCKNKMDNNLIKVKGNSTTLLCPTGVLPEDVFVKFEKQITFSLDEKVVLPSVSLNITPIDKVFFLIIKQNEGTIFKHIINQDQKYELIDKTKNHQYVFKYKIAQEELRINKVSSNQSTNVPEHEISLIFSSKPALNEFIEVLNLKK